MLSAELQAWVAKTGAELPWAFFEKLGVYQLNGTVKWYTAAPTAAR